MVQSRSTNILSMIKWIRTSSLTIKIPSPGLVGSPHDLYTGPKTCTWGPDHWVPVIDSGLVERGTTRAEVAQGTPTQSHISPSVLVPEENQAASWSSGSPDNLYTGLMTDEGSYLRRIDFSITQL